MNHDASRSICEMRFFEEKAVLEIHKTDIAVSPIRDFRGGFRVARYEPKLSIRRNRSRRTSAGGAWTKTLTSGRIAARVQTRRQQANLPQRLIALSVPSTRRLALF